MVVETMQGAEAMKFGSAVEAERRATGGESGSYRSGQAEPAIQRSAFKRVMDVSLAVIVLIFAAPLLAIVALLIKLQDGGPVFYGHLRCGRNGQLFNCLKIRTMHVDADERLAQLLANDPFAAEQWKRYRKLRNDPRITPIGHFLRKTSIDELPQLVNIIRGDMSVIGPRPVTLEETKLYGDAVSYYKAMRPGVLGLWQVKGRNLLSYEQRIAYDVEYVRDWTLWTDIKILFLAVPVVFLGRGAF